MSKSILHCSSHGRTFVYPKITIINQVFYPSVQKSEATEGFSVLTKMEFVTSDLSWVLISQKKTLCKCVVLLSGVSNYEYKSATHQWIPYYYSLSSFNQYKYLYCDASYVSAWYMFLLLVATKFPHTKYLRILTLYIFVILISDGSTLIGIST